MSKLGNTIYELHTIESLAGKDQWMNHIYPLVKLVLTVIYIGVVVSFGKYDLAHLLLMGVYPSVLFVVGEISFRESFWHLRVILPLVCMVGLLNPFFDRQVVFDVGGFGVTGGMISMITLVVKGCYSVFASYLLIATTTIEQLCHALRQLHVPAVFVTQILLTYRYVSVLLSEANRMMQAYSLRAPRQKGIHFKAWGSFVGQLLLRSMDRAAVVYESMTLRGYQGEFRYAVREKCRGKDYAWLLVWCMVFVGVRLG